MKAYSPSVMIVWEIAAAEAVASNLPDIEPAHLMIGLCKFSDLELGSLPLPPQLIQSGIGREIEADMEGLRDLFAKAGLDPSQFRRRLRGLIFSPNSETNLGRGLHRSQNARRVFEQAEKLAEQEANPREGIRPHHLLVALLEIPNPPWAQLLEEHGGLNSLRIVLEAAPRETLIPTHLAGTIQPQNPNSPLLNRFGRDLSQLAREDKLDPVIGRHSEIRSLARMLSLRQKNNAILVGEAGVGKTCIVEGLAQWFVSPSAPDNLKEKRIVSIALASLLAGTRYRGDFEERLEGIIKEAAANENIILFIDEIHGLLEAGGAGASDAANILKPALARGEIRVIGASTTTEYRRSIERDPALERRFQLIMVEEPSAEESLEILRGLRPKFEIHHGVRISDEAIQAALDLSIRYLSDLHLPDKAIDLIDQACAYVRIATLSNHTKLDAALHIGREELLAVVSERTGIPLEQLSHNQAERLMQMEHYLSQRVIGQDEAIRLVSEAVRAARVGLRDMRRPIGVFLFAGSTGTGKTELAKALSEFLFGDEARLIRIDMSEYMEKHQVARLIGAPPGYLGYEDEGLLISAVRSHPYSLVLFDEIEKAAPEVLDILLQILDEGRLTDAHGRTASFRETLIIMTSNVGASGIGAARKLGFRQLDKAMDEKQQNHEALREHVTTEIRQRLRPELINRIQQITVFYPLDENAVRQIIDKILETRRQALADYGMRLELTTSAYDLLMTHGYDMERGAREMERCVEQMIVQPLSRALLEKHFLEGAVIQVDANENQMIFKDIGGTQALPIHD